MYGLEEAGKEVWEETTNKVEEFLKASFGFTYRVVDVADRIGVYKKDKSRPIRIKFVRLYDRRLVMRDKVSKISDPIYINANLCIQDRKVSAVLRKKKKKCLAENEGFKCKIFRGRLMCYDSLGVKVKEFLVNEELKVVELTTAGMEIS